MVDCVKKKVITPIYNGPPTDQRYTESSKYYLLIYCERNIAEYLVSYHTVPIKEMSLIRRANVSYVKKRAHVSRVED